MNKGVHTPKDVTPFDSTERTLGVLVGFDGSAQGKPALHYAARAAQRRNIPLTVITVFDVPTMTYGTLAAVPPRSEEEASREVAEGILAQAREYLQEYPGEVNFRTERGNPTGVLVDLSAKAQLAVVGARGRGGFLGRILGSVAAALPAHARCPTIVVPRDYAVGEGHESENFTPVDLDTPVVVGVDGSAQSRLALLQGGQAASERGVTLHIVMMVPALDGLLSWYPEVSAESGYNSRRRAELQESLKEEADWLASHIPDVAVIARCEVGEAAEELAKKTASAQLTVVGTRGYGGLASTVLGSVSRGLLNHATGPVMVVPTVKDSRTESAPNPF